MWFGDLIKCPNCGVVYDINDCEVNEQDLDDYTFMVFKNYVCEKCNIEFVTADIIFDDIESEEVDGSVFCRNSAKIN